MRLRGFIPYRANPIGFRTPREILLRNSSTYFVLIKFRTRSVKFYHFEDSEIYSFVLDII